MDDKDKIPQSNSVKRKEEFNSDRKHKVARLQLDEQQANYDDSSHGDYVKDGNEEVNFIQNVLEGAENGNHMLDHGEDYNPYEITPQTAFDEQVQMHVITLCSTKQSNIRGIFDVVKKDFIRILQNGLNLHKKPIKVSLEIKGEKYISVTSTNTLKPQQNIENWFIARQKEMQEIFNESYGSYEENELNELWINFNVQDFCETRFRIDLKGIRNIDCSNDDSFKWSVLLGLHPTTTASVNNLRKYSHEINMDDINIPVQIHEISKIEERNNISINIFTMKYSPGVKRDVISGPVYHTKNRKIKHINLLYFLNHTTGTFRYCYIHDLNAVVDNTNNKPICDGCLNFIETDEILEKHKNEDCLHIETILHKNVIKFNNDHDHQMEHPIIVYADFEALLTPVNYTEPLVNISNTHNISKHIPAGYAYYVKCRYDDNLSILKSYNGQNCVDEFLNSLVSDLKLILCNYNNNKNGTIKFIPIFIHNLNYDAHFILDRIGSISLFDSVHVLGELYKYIAIYLVLKGKKTTLRFLDSMKFLDGSLESLASDLDLKEFKEIHRLCYNDEQGFKLLSKKLVFPYEYIQSFDDLLKTSLPEKNKFRNILKNSDASNDEYNGAKQVWKHFQCKTIGDYLNLYVKVDVLLLAEVFENLRQFCLSNYHLDPAYYYSKASLSWDAMLKYTKIELEPFTDIDMLLFIKKSIRGGVAHCSKRHAVANNKYLDNYKKDEEDRYVMYYDANNLYGYAMCQPLPYGGFEWVDTRNINVKDYYDLPSDSPVGYILEVDLDYPIQLHKHHKDFPFCPQKKAVPGSGNRELNVTDLTSKQKYVIHHSHLFLCVQQGLRIEAVHRILKFKQKEWLKPYIYFNNTHRMNAQSESENKFFKTMNNLIYGKTIQNIENYSNIKISRRFTDDWKNSCSNIMKEPDYQAHAVYSESMVAVKRLKPLEFNYPLYVGFCILELAKTYMYNFHYNIMKGKCFKKDKLQLLYTDTDSLLYQIDTHDYYKKIKDYLKDYFDTDNYGINNPYQFPQWNKNKLGFFKDVMEGAVVKEFVALKPKMYALDIQNKKGMNKATGVPRHITDQFTIDDYKNCLYSNKASTIEYYRIKSIGHDTYTQKRKTTGLTPTYTQRWISKNRVETLPWGHSDIPKSNQNDNEVE